jgi:hypothetical protein
MEPHRLEKMGAPVKIWRVGSSCARPRQQEDVEEGLEMGPGGPLLVRATAGEDRCGG